MITCLRCPPVIADFVPLLVHVLEIGKHGCFGPLQLTFGKAVSSYSLKFRQSSFKGFGLLVFTHRGREDEGIVVPGEEWPVVQ